MTFQLHSSPLPTHSPHLLLSIWVWLSLKKKYFWNIVLAVHIPFFLFTTLFKQEAVVAVQSLSCVQLFATPWTAMHQASVTITISQSLLKLMSTELVILFNHLKQEVAGPESKLSYNPLSSMFQEAQPWGKWDLLAMTKWELEGKEFLSV